MKKKTYIDFRNKYLLFLSDFIETCIFWAGFSKKKWKVLKFHIS